MTENLCHYCGNPDCFICDECEESWCNCDCETRYADEDDEEGVELFTSCVVCEQLVIPIDDEGMAPDTCGDCEARQAD